MKLESLENSSWALALKQRWDVWGAGAGAEGEKALMETLQAERMTNEETLMTSMTSLINSKKFPLEV